MSAATNLRSHASSTVSAAPTADGGLGSRICVRKLSSKGLFLRLQGRFAFFAGQEAVRENRVRFIVAAALTEGLH